MWRYLDVAGVPQLLHLHLALDLVDEKRELARPRHVRVLRVAPRGQGCTSGCVSLSISVYIVTLRKSSPAMWWWTIIPPTRGHGNGAYRRRRDALLLPLPSPVVLLLLVVPGPVVGAAVAAVVGAADGADDMHEKDA